MAGEVQLPLTETSGAAFVADFGGAYGVVGEEHSNPRSGEWMDVSIHSIMVGPKFTLHRGSVSPFVQTLIGVAHIKGSWAHRDYKENDLEVALGGGIDVNLDNRIALRPVQLDYFTTRRHRDYCRSFQVFHRSCIQAGETLREIRCGVLQWGRHEGRSHKSIVLICAEELLESNRA